MIIEKDKMVALEYVLREGNKEGGIVEEVNSDNPLKFVFGAGQMLPHFESNIKDLEKDAKFEFILSAAEAYGEKREEMVVDIPMSVFEVDGKVDENIIKVDNQVPMADAQGHRMVGTVISTSETVVKMDFNHPMAGSILHFKGSIVELREATEEEKNPKQSSCSSCNGETDCSESC